MKRGWETNLSQLEDLDSSTISKACLDKENAELIAAWLSRALLALMESSSKMCSPEWWVHIPCAAGLTNPSDCISLGR